VISPDTVPVRVWRGYGTKKSSLTGCRNLRSFSCATEDAGYGNSESPPAPTGGVFLEAHIWALEWAFSFSR